MSKEAIVSTKDYFKELEKRYAGLQYNIETMKPWFSKTKKIFFQCRKAEDKDDCLGKILSRQDSIEFVIVSIVEEAEEGVKATYLIDESRFKRIGKETIGDFINRFHKTLQEPFGLSMQLFNRKQIEVVGFSYTSPEDRSELLKELKGTR